MNKKTKKAYEYLFENGQVILKYEAAKKLGIATSELRLEMLAHPAVQYWIEQSQEFLIRPRIHDSMDTRLENWMQKLISFGVRPEDDVRLENVCKHALQYVKDHNDDLKFFDSISNVIAASCLSIMGYDDAIILDTLRQRVELVYEFTQHKDYNIHVDKKDYPTIPKQRNHHPLCNPKLYQDNIWRLPTVYDMYAYANMPGSLQSDTELMQKIDTIIEYILHDEYQHKHWGYGLMLIPPKIYYSMGWSVHLANYFPDGGRAPMNEIVWGMELMSHFETARRSEWFIRTLMHLENFEQDGLYTFPREYIREGKNSYYVGGGHMGLGENRRSKSYATLESTAWMLRIKNNL